MSEDEYYQTILRNYSDLDNKNAQRIYFEETQPGDLPTHSRILNCDAVEAIFEAFFYRLTMDLVRNTRFSWKPGSKLRGWKEYVQPLADGSPDTWEKNAHLDAADAVPEPVPELEQIQSAGALAFAPVVPYHPWVRPSEVVTPKELHEVEEMLRKIERLEGQKKSTVKIGFGHFKIHAAMRGMALWAILAYATWPLMQQIVGTKTAIKTQKRKRSKLCATWCANILRDNAQFVKENDYSRYRAIETEDRAPRIRKKFKSRK